MTEATYLVQLVLAPLGIEDGRVIAIVEQMSCGNKTIATFVQAVSFRMTLSINKPKHTVVSRATGHENLASHIGRMDPIHYISRVY